MSSSNPHAVLAAASGAYVAVLTAGPDAEGELTVAIRPRN